MRSAPSFKLEDVQDKGCGLDFTRPYQGWVSFLQVKTESWPGWQLPGALNLKSLRHARCCQLFKFRSLFWAEVLQILTCIDLNGRGTPSTRRRGEGACLFAFVRLCLCGDPVQQTHGAARARPGFGNPALVQLSFPGPIPLSFVFGRGCFNSGLRFRPHVAVRAHVRSQTWNIPSAWRL